MKLQLHATPEEVMRAVERLESFGRDLGIREGELFGVALSLEECGSNIVNHALGRDATKTFEVQMELKRGTLMIELRDRGPAFDPTLVPDREPQTAEDELPGGWGIQLVRQYIDEICYRREGGENVLVLKKTISSPINFSDSTQN
jgi:anti-sigma regulatory factor (Ser/Thr protein kinase)